MSVKLRCGHLFEKNNIFKHNKCLICNKQIFKKNQQIFIKNSRYGASEQNPIKGIVYNVKNDLYLEIKFENDKVPGSEIFTILKLHCL